MYECHFLVFFRSFAVVPNFATPSDLFLFPCSNIKFFYRKKVAFLLMTNLADNVLRSRKDLVGYETLCLTSPLNDLTCPIFQVHILTVSSDP